MKRLTTGALLIFFGFLLDRVLYCLLYLPSINKTFALWATSDEVARFYSSPINCTGIALVIGGLIIAFIPWKRTKQ